MVSLLLSPYSQIPLSEQRVLDKQMGFATCNVCVGRGEELLTPALPNCLGFGSCLLTLSCALV